MKGKNRIDWKSFLKVVFVIVLICLILNQPLLGLFGLGAEALSYGKYMLMIYLAAGTVRTCNYIMNCCYRAGGEAVFGTVLELGCLFLVSVPAIWIAGMVLYLPFLAVFARKELAAQRQSA